MTSVTVIKNQTGGIVDTKGINVGALVDHNPAIKVKTNTNNQVLGVDSHITLVPDIISGTGGGSGGDVDGGSF